MDFKEAIRAHSKWKLKLSQYLGNPDGSLQSSVVESDNGCTLGQWLYGDGRRYELLPEFQQAKLLHSRFHVAAADVVSRANRGDVKVSSEILLGSGSEYARSSSAVVAAIMKLDAKVAARP